MKRLIVYGSLKSDRYNNHMLKESKLVGKTRVVGTMYSLGAYPALLKEGTNKYDAEIWEVDENTHHRIQRMELGAGYQEVETDEGVIYYAGLQLADMCRERMEQIEMY